MTKPKKTDAEKPTVGSKVKEERTPQASNDAEPCACCALFFSDYAVQELERRWDNPRGLQRLVKELLEEGFGHFAKPILWRWKKLTPDSPAYKELRMRVDDQIWLAGTSKQIHDLESPMSDADIERLVGHDIAYLERKWERNESGRT